MPETATMILLALIFIVACIVIRNSTKREWGENHVSWW